MDVASQRAITSASAPYTPFSIWTFSPSCPPTFVMLTIAAARPEPVKSSQIPFRFAPNLPAVFAKGFPTRQQNLLTDGICHGHGRHVVIARPEIVRRGLDIEGRPELGVAVDL